MANEKKILCRECRKHIATTTEDRYLRSNTVMDNVLCDCCRGACKDSFCACGGSKKQFSRLR